MLSISEASLLKLHAGNEDEAFQARMKRDTDEAHFLPRGETQSKALVPSPPRVWHNSGLSDKRTAEEEAVLYPIYRQVFGGDIGASTSGADVAGEEKSKRMHVKFLFHFFFF
jgi:hypothetical protein